MTGVTSPPGSRVNSDKIANGQAGNEGAGSKPTYMGIRQAWHDIRELRRELSELSAPSTEEREAGYKLAVSATRFSRRSKRVVDDKLNFSATLMRAGEVDAANRLLEEFERDIRDEEAALIECVNEVKVANSLRKERVSRLRLVRLMAVALLGACVMSFSALGIAVAGMFQDRQSHRAADRIANHDRVSSVAGKQLAGRAKSPRSRRSLHALDVVGARQSLTAQQLHTYVRLAASGDDASLQDFLMSVLPSTLAQKVSSVLGVAEEVTDTVSPPPDVNPGKISDKSKEHADKAASQAPKEDGEEPSKDASPPPDSNDDQSTNSGNNSGDDGQDGEGDSNRDGILPGDGGIGGGGS